MKHHEQRERHDHAVVARGGLAHVELDGRRAAHQRLVAAGALGGCSRTSGTSAKASVE